MVKENFFQIKDQWNYIGIPEESNGFAIIILGGSIGFVSESDTDWHQEPKKKALISSLFESGYTVAYSNAHNENYGSVNAVHDIKDLYKVLIAETKVNPVVHLFAISMGAILGLRLMKESIFPICSVAFSQPLLNIKAQRQYENEFILRNKLNIEHDPLGKAIAKAHNIPLELIDEYINKLDLLKSPLSSIPCKIWHGTGDINVPADINAFYFSQLRINNGLQISLDIQQGAGHDKKGICYSDHKDIINFYNKYESLF